MNLNAPYKVYNARNGEWMWDDTFNRRMDRKRTAKLPILEWTGPDREGRTLTVIGVSSRWKPMEMLDVYEIYQDTE